MTLGEAIQRCEEVPSAQPERASSKQVTGKLTLISRQDAVDVVRNCNVKEVTPNYMLIDKAEIMTELMMLPSAQPERKKGKWIDLWDRYRCSVCNMEHAYEENFCPNCGADMKEGGHHDD